MILLADHEGLDLTAQISERNDFNNSESLCHCDASHQVLSQSDLRFGRRCRLKNFKMASMAVSLMWCQDFQDGHSGGNL